MASAAATRVPQPDIRYRDQRTDEAEGDSMKSTWTAAAPALLVAMSLGVAFAKIPAPAPLDPAKAEQKKAADAASAAITAAQQAKAEDRTAAYYIQQQKAKGKAVTPQMPPNAAELDAKAKEAAAKAAAATAAITPAPAAPAVVAAAAPATAAPAAPKK